MKLAVIYLVLILIVIFVLTRVFKVIKEGDAELENIMEKKKDEEIVKYLCEFLIPDKRSQRIRALEGGEAHSDLFVSTKEELNALYNITDVKKIHEENIEELTNRLKA